MARQMPKVDGSRGAPMGRGAWPLTERFGDFNPDANVFAKPARCFHVRMDSGGYDDGGAYWGNDRVWCATNGFDGDDTFQLFIDAGSREEAKAKALAMAPRIRWIR